MTDFIDDFTSDIPRGVSSRYLRQQRAPQASWQSPETILKRKQLAYDPDNPGRMILVGALDGKLIGIDDNRHMLTAGGSRSGKSVFVTNNFLFYPGSILAIDPKAELANITAARRAELGQKVCILDPFGQANADLDQYLATYNPLNVLTLDNPTIIEDAGLIADALVISSGKDLHWDESALSFIEGLMLHVVTASQYEGQRDLIMVRELIKNALMERDIGDDASLFVVEEEMLENAARLSSQDATRDIGAALLGSARDFFDRSDRERDSVLSTVRRHTKLLDYPAMRRTLKDSRGANRLDLADLKRLKKGLSVYLCLPASRIGQCNRWFRIFINQLLVAMEKEKRVPDAPVLVCLDEFPALGYMRQLEDAAGLIASFHVKLWVLLQDWGQGKTLYKERWESFTANAGILQFFGNNDLATTEYIAKRLGKTRIEVTRQGEVAAKQSEDGLSGKNEAYELHDLCTPEEITRLFARSDRLKRQLVIWTGYNPMILQRVEYFDETGPFADVFKGKWAKP